MWGPPLSQACLAHGKTTTFNPILCLLDHYGPTLDVTVSNGVLGLNSKADYLLCYSFVFVIFFIFCTFST